MAIGTYDWQQEQLRQEIMRMARIEAQKGLNNNPFLGAGGGGSFPGQPRIKVGENKEPSKKLLLLPQ